jgi:hypothetical protein
MPDMTEKDKNKDKSIPPAFENYAMTDIDRKEEGGVPHVSDRGVREAKKFVERNQK